MTKTYKLWIEIEEYDEETDEYQDISKDGTVEPIDCGVFSTQADAVNAAEAIGVLASAMTRNYRDIAPEDVPVLDTTGSAGTIAFNIEQCYTDVGSYMPPLRHPIWFTDELLDLHGVPEPLRDQVIGLVGYHQWVRKGDIIEFGLPGRHENVIE